MKSQSSVFDPLAFLQLMLAVFFITTALMFLINYNSSGAQIGRAIGEFFGKGQRNMVQMVTAILELCAGVLLTVGLLGIIPKNVMFPVTIVIFILWGVQMAFLHFVNGFLKPDFLVWLQPVSLNAVVLTALWGCASRYRD